jgi:hypothetical protein
MGDQKFIISSSSVLAPTNPHWASVVGYDPFSLCVNHKEGLCQFATFKYVSDRVNPIFYEKAASFVR